MVPLSQLKYHPNRYLASRPFAELFLDSYVATVGRDLPTAAAFGTMLDLLGEIYNMEIERLPIGHRPKGMQLFHDELSLSMNVGAFIANGRNIFDFPPRMADMFLMTDVADVPLTSLQFPYRVFYMSFGQQAHLNLWEAGYFVDGAYIALCGHELAVFLSTVRDDVDYQNTLTYLLKPDRYYFFSLKLKDQASTVGEAIEATIKREDPFTPRMVGGPMPEKIAVGGKEVAVIDNRPFSSVEVAAEKLSGFGVFRDSMNLVINGLCYISAYRSDTIGRYPDEAPQELVKKLQAAKTPKHRARAQSKLVALGFTKIHFCGRAFDQLHSSMFTGREVSTHWRRGHWRNQPFGEGRANHRLIWIMPTVVRQDKGHPKSGHIYLMDEPEV